MKVIINSPSLDPALNVSGISSVARFILDYDTEVDFTHFIVGRSDGNSAIHGRVSAILKSLHKWRRLTGCNSDAVIHYNMPLSSLSIYRDFLFLAIVRNQPVVLHIHGGQYLMKDTKPVIANFLLRKMFAWSRTVIVLSDLEKELIEKAYPANAVEVLPNCPDPASFTPVQKVKLPSDPLVMGYLGRIVHDKGMTELYNACEEMKCRGVQFQLCVAGSENGTEYLEMFRNLLGESFSYAGVVSGEEKKRFINKLDIFVLPSYYEGLPVSLLECMGAGAVPVVTKVGSIETVVINGENGVSIDTHSSSSIVDAILALDKDRPMLSRLSINAIQTINNRFSPETYVAHLNAIYSSVALQ